MKRSLLFARQWTRIVSGPYQTKVRFHPILFPAPHVPVVRTSRVRDFGSMTSSDDQCVHIKEERKKQQYHPKLLERTKYLLDPSNQLNATDPDLWTEADHALRAWLDPNIAPDLTALKRVEWCLRLLDRLSNILPKGEMFFVSLFERDILHQILRTWQIGVDVRSKNEQMNHRRLFTPSFMAAKIDKYRWTSLLQPDSQTFNLLLHAAPMFPYRDGVAFADGLLQKLVEVTRADDSMEELPLMDVASVATVMRAWVNHHQPDKADEWLRRLESWQREEGDTSLGKLLPNKLVYTIALSGWAKVGMAQNALDILERQLISFQQGNSDCRPDTVTFNCVLDALAKSNDRTGWAIQKAEQILREMKEFGTPDAHTWTTVLSCYMRQKPSMAERLLRQLEAEEGRDNIPVSAYNVMLNGYAHAGNIKAAVDLLEKLEGSSSALRPDIVSYNTVLSAYARLKTTDAAHQADAFFRRIVHEEPRITPTVTTYGAMMQCWSKSSDLDAADRAEGLLRDMEQRGPTPTTACYNIVLSAWGNQATLRGASRSHVEYAVTRLLHVFQEMATGDAGVRPDDGTFRAVMHAVVSISSPQKGDLLDFLVAAMKQHGFRPRGKDEQLLRRCLKHHRNVATL
jgi:pentatricopeptide repeat protein